MKRNSLTSLLVLAGIIGFTACNNDEKTDTNDTTTNTTTTPAGDTSSSQEVHGTEVKAGEITYQSPLNAEWVSHGKSIYELKCASCHKLTDERLVGPGWKGVTKRREPEWIVNMITNVDMMLESDPEAQKLLEQCLVRMPNQNISRDEARHIIEYMRSNDGEK
jgi:mono/diheme cytochrome c family protein